MPSNFKTVYSFPGYNERVTQLNDMLRVAYSKVPGVTFWRHRGLSNPGQNLFLADSNHLNNRGTKALYRSYRGAIMFLAFIITYW